MKRLITYLLGSVAILSAILFLGFGLPADAQSVPAGPVTATVVGGSLKVGKPDPFQVPPGTLLKGTTDAKGVLTIPKSNIKFPAVPYGQLSIQITPAGDATGKVEGNSLANLKLKLFVKIVGGTLGNSCAIGSASGPITLNLTGSGGALADNSFSVPAAVGCGDSTKLINGLIGLPASSGNAASFNLTLGTASTGGGGAVVVSTPDLKIEAGDTAKKFVAISLSEAPKTAVNLRATTPANDTGLFALDSRSATVEPANTPIKIGVTLNAGAAAGKYDTVTFEGTSGKARYVGSFKVTVIKKGEISTGGTTVAPPISSGEGAKSILGLKLLPDCLTTNAQDAKIGCVSETIAHFTNLLLWLIAIGAFLYLLYGAFLYTTTYGDETKVKTAKNIIKYALIGIVIATLANVIVHTLQTTLMVTGV